jgi:riboflavin kinase/FMN adenylyltransferase
MEVILETANPGFKLGHSVVTVGAFDGIHLGHRALVSRAAEIAREMGEPLVALSFDQHPLAVLAPEKAPKLIMGPRLRNRVLAELGVDYLFLMHFDENRAHQSAEEFIEATLLTQLGAKAVAVGENFTFGYKGTGTPELLRNYGTKNGFMVEIVELLKVGSVAQLDDIDPMQPISATLIRSLIQSGRIRDAGVLLGQHFTLEGTVVEGDHRGTALGFPTANLIVDATFVQPPDGVYAALAELKGTVFPAAVSLGTRPMYYPQGGPRLLEVHILGYSGDLYGQTVAVSFLERIREQQVFDDEEGLRDQIATDIAAIERIAKPHC